MRATFLFFYQSGGKLSTTDIRLGQLARLLFFWFFIFIDIQLEAAFAAITAITAAMLRFLVFLLYRDKDCSQDFFLLDPSLDWGKLFAVKPPRVKW